MFKLLCTHGNARRGEYTTSHGTIQTPVFMNVGTQAAIKGGLSSVDLEEVGCQVELSNTYHLHVRPGEDVIESLGGLHKFMDWNKPVLTDSGGFQVFSLAQLRKISEEGVTFQSHVDGRKIFMGPEQSIAIQSALGSDIAMAFDECVSNPSTHDYVKASCLRTTRWLERCKAELLHRANLSVVNPSQELWGIVQGGVYDDLRIEHCKSILELDLPGYAIGGLAVGEEAEVMYHIIDTLNEYMYQDRPRYLMGVGTPGNIIEAVFRGIDFFDCVMPSRNARHGHLFTWEGCRNLNNEKYKYDDLPVEENCQCPACKHFSRGYIRHLLKSGEILGGRLGVIHNLYFYNNLMLKIREALENHAYTEFRNKYAKLLDSRI